MTTFSFSVQRLANTKAHTSRFVTANLPCNKFKNRLVNIMPYETTRVCLQPIRGLEGSDYINASYIDGYRYVFILKTLIWPDPLILFWRLDEWMDWIGFHHSALTCHVLSDLSLLYTCSPYLSCCAALASVRGEGDGTLKRFWWFRHSEWLHTHVLTVPLLAWSLTPFSVWCLTKEETGRRRLHDVCVCVCV